MKRMPSALWLLVCAACSGPEAPSRVEPTPVLTPAAAVPGESVNEGALRIVVVGDSLAAGYGLGEEQAFPALVEERLRARGWHVDVINGGVSGDTTAGGLARLAWLLRQEPDLVILELGANDGLRGVPIESIAANLRDLVDRSRQSGAHVLLLGMRIPPNYGDEYAGRFAEIYRRLAADLDVPLMPFLLEGVGGRSELNLPDGIHPNAAGHGVVAAAVVPHVEPILRALADSTVARDAA